MPFTIICPNCDKRLVVPDELNGKKVKCKACGTSVLARRAADDVDDSDARPQRSQSKKRPAAKVEDDDFEPKKAKRAVSRPRDDDEDDDSTPPSKKTSRSPKGNRSGATGARKKKKSKNGLLVGLVIGGISLVMVLVCGGTIGYYATRESREVRNGLTRPPGLKDDDGKKKYTPQEFERLVMGKTPEQVIAAVGKADDSKASETWYYLFMITYGAGSPDGHATLTFVGGKVAAVKFS